MAGKDLSVRMKNYEDCYNFRIPSRSYIIIRLDGKNFSKYTTMFAKPFDDILSDVMDMATIGLCKKLNPKFAYTQSDEISLLFTDIDNIESETIFDGKVQKLASIAASMVTSEFNFAMLKMLSVLKYTPLEVSNMIATGKFPEITAIFDARVFVLPDFREVSNYFVWRNQDCVRNSITMAAGSVYSHKELHGKSGSEKQEMLFQKGINWNDYKPKYKRGIIIKKHQISVEGPNGEQALRNKWVPADYSLELIQSLIPTNYNISPTTG